LLEKNSQVDDDGLLGYENLQAPGEQSSVSLTLAVQVP
jgi:hypothetical protein